MIALLKTAGAEGMTVPQLAVRYVVLPQHLGRPHQTLALVAKCMYKVLGARVSKLRQKVEADQGADNEGTRTPSDKARWVLTSPDTYEGSIGALTFFGPRGGKHHSAAEQMADDVDTKPRLVVIPTRFSFRDGTLNITDTARDSSQRVFELWELVHNGRPQPATTFDVDSPDDFDAGSPAFHFFAHTMSPRASDNLVFQDNHRQPDDSDLCLMGNPQKFDDDAAVKSLQGEERPPITYVVAGSDG